MKLEGSQDHLECWHGTRTKERQPGVLPRMADSVWYLIIDSWEHGLINSWALIFVIKGYLTDTTIDHQSLGSSGWWHTDQIQSSLSILIMVISLSPLLSSSCDRKHVVLGFFFFCVCVMSLNTMSSNTINFSVKDKISLFKKWPNNSPCVHMTHIIDSFTVCHLA